MTVKNQVQLITYPDSLGGDLKGLRWVLDTHLAGIFKGGVHILPPFPSSGDRGFAPLTYLEIDPAFGDWEDVKAIGESHDVLVDLMVNHISRRSPFFQDFLKKGRESDYADLFVTLDKLWPDGNPVQTDIDRMFLRREKPYSVFAVGSDAGKETVWTTFGKTDPSEQIDLDIHSEKTRRLFEEFFRNFQRNNVKIVRLDAVGYVIKKPGTSCFFVEPDIYEFLDWIAELARSHEIELLPEVHSHYSIQYKLAERGFWIYDFIMPYRILEAMLIRDGSELLRYLQTRPRNQFTMLDCHDGIPVKPDLDDLVDAAAVRNIVNVCVERGANLSRIVSDKHKGEDGFDVHQIRCSYYSALNGDDNAYLTARAIQFFAPGIPQVYYAGLLAAENDEEGVRRTGEGREINRPNFTTEEIERALEKDAVKRLLRLIRFRNEYEAFQGEFEILDAPDSELRLQWRKGELSCVLTVDLNDCQSVIRYIDDNGETITYKV